MNTADKTMAPSVSVMNVIKYGEVDKPIQKNGDTPLIAVSRHGSLVDAKELIAAGASINARNNLGQTALIQAARHDRLSVVQFLLSHTSCLVNEYDKSGKSALFHAVNEGHTQIVSALLEREDIDVWSASQEYDKKTPLMCACIAGNVGLVQILRQRGACLDAVDAFGWTAAMISSFYGHMHMIQALGGCDLNIQANKGCTALHLAAREGHVSVVEALIEASAFVDVSNHEGDTPLLLAVQRGREIVVNTLFERSEPNVNAVNLQGWSACMYAARDGYVSLVRTLISKGCDVNATTLINKRTALHVSAVNGHQEISELLVKAGSSLMCPDGEGNTPRTLAGSMGHRKLASVLEKKERDLQRPRRQGLWASVINMIKFTWRAKKPDQDSEKRVVMSSKCNIQIVDSIVKEDHEGEPSGAHMSQMSPSCADAQMSTAHSATPTQLAQPASTGHASSTDETSSRMDFSMGGVGSLVAGPVMDAVNMCLRQQSGGDVQEQSSGADSGISGLAGRFSNATSPINVHINVNAQYVVLGKEGKIEIAQSQDAPEDDAKEGYSANDEASSLENAGSQALKTGKDEMPTSPLNASVKRKTTNEVAFSNGAAVVLETLTDSRFEVHEGEPLFVPETELGRTPRNDPHSQGSQLMSSVRNYSERTEMLDNVNFEHWDDQNTADPQRFCRTIIEDSEIMSTTSMMVARTRKSDIFHGCDEIQVEKFNDHAIISSTGRVGDVYLKETKSNSDVPFQKDMTTPEFEACFVPHEQTKPTCFDISPEHFDSSGSFSSCSDTMDFTSSTCGTRGSTIALTTSSGIEFYRFEGEDEEDYLLRSPAEHNTTCDSVNIHANGRVEEICEHEKESETCEVMSKQDKDETLVKQIEDSGEGEDSLTYVKRLARQGREEEDTDGINGEKRFSVWDL